ncbi:Cytochrome c551 peroxidase [BD1-7 clade bacterium]|uniref:Cytochrome c551 peroxidase n=1 Tax=BD1-7 clade bacterium TaxID=2029982 RepID=A0A5S9QSK3_9GAMM|nr:Cytochrome c551 peroxidase [BD1-7 clade bacterium]CAA0122234.1 Cytochrome c551 peroxidase [BD1-7 clade bacterium]
MLTKARCIAVMMMGLPLWGCDNDNDSRRSGSNDTDELRQFIGSQVGGLDKLTVPESNDDLPQPLLADGTPDPFFQTTEAKRFLGKQLFHDPVRTVRIRPAFGGIPETAKTGSCGSCHFGDVGSKAGTLFNFSVGGEGRGYTDAQGNFIPRRRPRTDLLPTIRDTPLFEGDALVDALPTLTDVYERAVGSPARGNKLPDPGELIATGRLDPIDSVSRNAPTIVGAAYNNRLLLGGFAGEPDDAPGGLNPFGHPAQENVTLLLLDAHRMLEAQSAELQQIPAYVRLFREAFPDEAREADTQNDMNKLINDMTVFRATASFLRTVVTRNTPWDQFLAGDNTAMTAAQQRGARLFFTDATEGGAGCYSCHSGPMFNKQPNDPDVTGMGEFIEENFYNLGLADHPLQALNRLARNDQSFRDDGRREITEREDDAFKFRVLTLRQLKGSKNFFHNGLFTSVEEVVQYFNHGIPQGVVSGTNATLSPRFTNPRGPDAPRGLGLTDAQTADITAFIEDALFDPAFITYDPDSTTDSFQLNERDFNYSLYRPDLASLGAIDGRVISGLAEDNNDPLSRRDKGLEFLDVTDQLDTALIQRQQPDQQQHDLYQLTNNSDAVVDTHLLIIVKNLPSGTEMLNASGTTSDGNPYLRVFLKDGIISPTKRIDSKLLFGFTTPPTGEPPLIDYNLQFMSGQGVP